jgi:hypothetical protein
MFIFKDNKIKKEHVLDGITRYKITNQVTDSWLSFDVIDMEAELTDEMRNYLGIIEGDIYYLCYKAVKKFAVIRGWNEPGIPYSTMYQYVNEIIELFDGLSGFDKIPVFLVIDRDNPDIDDVIGDAASKGFMTADHLVDFENNFCMVNTDINTYKFLNRNYYYRNNV